MNKRRKMRTSCMQQMIRELIVEEGLDLSSDDDIDQNTGAQGAQTKSKRGRPSIPDKWTRVISVHTDDLSNIKTYDLGPELIFDQGLGGVSQGRGR